jgi:TRAP-type mannitol/chloroaromatic compound transport system permease large subunit
MSYELIAGTMFLAMMVLLGSGARVFGAIGFVGAAAALLLWGEGATTMPFAGAVKLESWYALVTVPMFILMGYLLAESGIASDLYRMFHVWMGGLRGGLAIGTIGLMVLISVINGLSIAGMAIGATIALPELLKRNYDKRMVTGVIQAGSTLGILIPPSVVMVLYAMIARQPVDQLWLAGVIPGLMLAAMFIVYIAVRCWLQPELGPPLPAAERREAGAAPGGVRAAACFRRDDHAVHHRHHQPRRKLRRGRNRCGAGGVVEGPADARALAEHLAADPRHHLHVHVDHPRRAVLRRRVRRSRRSEGGGVALP